MQKRLEKIVSSSESKTALLRSGMKLIYELGFNGISVDQVLADARQPKGVFYHYFDNKEDFGLNVLDAYANALLADAQKVMANPKYPPLKRIGFHFKASSEQFELHGWRLGCLLGNLSSELADGRSAFQKRAAMHFAAFRQTIASCIREGQDEGSIVMTAPPDELAQFLISAWEGALLCDKATKTGDAVHGFFSIAMKSLEKLKH